MAVIGGINFLFKTKVPFNPFSGPPQIGMEDAEIDSLIGQLQTAILGSTATINLFKPLQSRTIYLRFDNLSVGSSGAGHTYRTLDPSEEFKAGSGNLSTVTTNGQVEVLLVGYNIPQPNGGANFYTPTGAYVAGNVARELFHELVHAVTVPAIGTSPFKSNNINTDENIAIAAENLIWVPDHGGSTRVGHGNPGGASIDPAIAFKGLGAANFNKVFFDGQIAAKFSVQSGSETLSKWYLGVGYGASVYTQGRATGRQSLDNVTLLGVYGSAPVVSNKGVPSAMVKRLLSGVLSDGKGTQDALTSVAKTEDYLTDLSESIRNVFGSIKLSTALAAPDLSLVTRALGISNETSVADVRHTGPIDAVTGGAAARLYLHGVSSGTLLIGGSGDVDSRHQINFEKATDTLVAGGAGTATNILIAGTGKSATAGVRNELIGGVGADYLVGQSGNDSLIGGKGDDVLIKSAGSDWLDGGSGLNTVVLPQDSKLAETVDMRTVASKGYGTITDGNGTSQVKNVQVIVGGAGKATFYGNGHNVFIAGSGGAEFHLQSGDVAIANPNSKVGNVYYVTSTDIAKNHIGIVGIGKNDKLYVDGRLFNGSTAFATSLGQSYDSNHDGPGNAGVYARVSSGWETKVTEPHLYDTFNQPPENGLRYHYWINGTDLYTPSPQNLKDVTYVKSSEQSGTTAGDIYFTSQTADGFGSTTLDGALDISVVGWQQGYAGINFYENNLARDTLGAFSIGGGISGWTGQILGGGGNANAALNPGYYKIGDDLTAVGGLFDPNSSEWQTTDPNATSAWDQIDQLISAIVDDTTSGDDLPDWSPFGPSGDDSGGGGPGPLGYSAGDGDDQPAAVPLQGDSSANILDPAGGYGEVIGGGGGDTIVYNLGYGSVVIDEQDSTVSPSNVLQFGTGILPGDVTIDGNADGDLLLTIAEDSTITIKGALRSTAVQTNGVQQVTFSDGTTWTYSDLLTAVSTSSRGRLAIFGDSAANTLDVAGYATSAVGGGGGDTFVFEAGYGDVTIDERDTSVSATNTLAFGAGLSPSALSVTADSDGSIIIDFGAGDRVTIANALLSDDETAFGIQQVSFADGTTWSYADLLSLADTASADNRALYGDRSSNYLWGGGIATSLTGGGGGDTFEFDRGDKPITIYESDSGAAPTNQLYISGFDPGDITVSADAAGDILLHGDGAVQITIVGALNSDSQIARGVQSIAFGNGTTWSYSDLVGFATTASSDNVELFGDSQANLFDSMGLGTSIVGRGGGDTILYERGYGALSVVEVDASSSATNTLQFGTGIAAMDVAVAGDTNGNLILSLGNGDTITLVAALLSSGATANGVQAVTFADGTSWAYADLLQRALSPIANGTIVGDTAANTIDSEGVAAYAVGNGGGDTFLFNAGYGALTIDERDGTAVANNGLSLGIGLDPASTTVSATTEGDLVLSFGGGDEITLVNALRTDGADAFGVQAVTFHDGTSWSYADLLAKVATPASGSTIFGDRSGNVLDSAGLAGAVIGGGGGDTIVFNQGYGQVTLLEADYSSSPDNVLQLGAGIDPSQVTVTGNAAGDIILDIGGGDSIILANALRSTSDCTYGIQQMAFQDGTTWDYDDILATLAAPSASNTTLYGDSGANVLDGAGVANILVGNGGDDTFLFNQGDGALTIDEQDSAGLPDNRLVLGTGILTTDVDVSATTDGDLVLTMTGSDEITLKNALHSDVETTFGVQEVQFDDGTIWTYSDLVALAATPSSSQTTLYGDAYANEFDSAGVAHRIVGAGGGDEFYYARGYGALSINEFETADNRTNCLTFGPDIAPDDITISTSGGDILLSLGGGDVVTLEAANTSVAGASVGVQQVKFSGGLSWNAAQLKAIVSGAWAIADDGGFTAIDEAVNVGSSTPVIQLAFASTDATVTLGDDRQSLTLSSANGTIVTINDLLRIGAGSAQTIAFSDGTTWSLNDAIAQAANTADAINYEVGTSAAESFNFANGVKEIIGFGGGDRIQYDRGDGYVILDETDHSPVPDNVLVLGPDIALSDLTITSDGASLFLALPDGDQVVLSNALLSDESTSYGVQRVSFYDGSEATYAQLLAIADTGSADNSGTLYGDGNANLIDTVGFAHAVVGAGGADTIVYNRGYGDLEIADTASSGGTAANILFGADITLADIAIEPDEGNGYSVGQRPAMRITVAGEGTILIDNQLSGGPTVTQLSFVDGTTLDYADMLELLGTPVAGRQAIGGDYAANDLDTQGLVHEVVGNGGGDTIKYDRGYGTLDIEEDDADPAANNKLVFAAGITPGDVAASLSYQGVFSLDLGGGDIVSFKAPQFFTGSGVQEIDFADGTSWDSAQLLQIVDTGAPGKIFMQGTSLNETFDGQGYTRYIAGAGGGDTYLFNQGYGAETIYDSGYFGSNPNTIAFGAGIDPADVAVSEYNGNLILSIGASDRLLVLSQFAYNNYYGVQRVTFEDGTVWNSSTLATMAFATPSGAAAVINPGSGTSDEIDLPTLLSGDLTTSDTLSFTDDDSNDVHHVSVVDVSYSSTSFASLPDQTEMLSYLSAAIATEPGTNPGSIEWSFSAPTDKFAALAPGESVDITFTLLLKDENNAATTQNVVVSVVAPDSSSLRSNSFAFSKMASYDDGYRAQRLFTNDLAANFAKSRVSWKKVSLASVFEPDESLSAVPTSIGSPLSARGASVTSRQTYQLASVVDDGTQRAMVAQQAGMLAQSLASFGVADAGDPSSYLADTKQDLLLAISRHQIKPTLQGSWDLTV